MTNFPEKAMALCTGPEDPSLLGIWENAVPNSQGVQQVNVDYLCEDALSCDDETGACTSLQVGYFVNVLQSSPAKDYEWGQKKATYLPENEVLQVLYKGASRETQFQVSVIKDGARKGQLLLDWTQFITHQDELKKFSGIEYFTKR